MKKIMSIGLAFCIILSLLLSPFETFAADPLSFKLGTPSSVSEITYSQNGSNEEIRFVTASKQILSTSLIAPEGSATNYRLLFKIANASIPKSVSFNVDKGSVYQIRCSNINDIKALSVVIETTTKPSYTFLPSSDGKALVLRLAGTGSTSNQASSPTPTPKPSATPTASPKPTVTPTPSSTPKPSASPSSTPKPSSTPTQTTSTPKPGTNTSVNTGKPVVAQNGPLSWTMSDDTCVIKFKGISLTQAKSGNTPRFELRENEKLIQVTIPGNDAGFKQGMLSGNSVIYGMLVNYNQNLNQTLIRISYQNKVTFTHEVVDGSSVIKVKSASTNVPASSGGTTPKPSTSPTPSSTPKPTTVPATSDTPDTNNSANVNITFNPGSVQASSPATTGTKVYRIGNPSRIVIEVPGTAGALDKLMPAGSLYSRASVSQSGANTVKVEIYTNGMPEWNLTQGPSAIQLDLAKTDITNLEAGRNDGSVAARIVNTGIVARYRQQIDQVVLDDSVSNSSFTFVFPVGVVNLGNGTATIDDSLVKTIMTLTTPQNSFLLINKKDPNKQFKIIEGSTPDELLVVAVTADIKPPSNKPKLVVLDPGHGGSDPGGVVDVYKEKDYNLDIALRCEAILKAKGINVLLTRRTDVFVDLDERANFANRNNATLFLSIHNNIMPANTKGSMSLYYPSSYSGKAYAQIMQNNLVTDLGTGNIGLSARGGLVVLRKTNMPAVLAEVACMTDSGDLTLLNTEAFRQKAAESLAKTVEQILSSQ